MLNASTIISYFIIFFAVYIQVFFLVTFLEKRKETKRRTGDIKLKRYPSVTVIVPCWDEEGTIKKTVGSLLKLDYPKDKLEILIIDDGSTDNTWNVIKQFKKNPQIKVFKKENGGKYTALNFGLKHATSELVGCLDADSFVEPQTLKRMVAHFENPEIMAVAPAVLVYKPKTITQWAQRAEYNMAVYIKKMLGLIDGLHVATGAFSIFRKKVFDTLGPYRKAHYGEDLEITYRMQANHYKIYQCHDAYTYTVAPNTVWKLYRQRIRWIYGFLNNTIDYRRLLFRKKYGNFALFAVPAGLISIVAALYLFGSLFYRLISHVIEKVVQVQTVGFGTTFNFDWFFINTGTFMFLMIVLYSMLITSMIIGRYMAEGKIRVSFDIVYFIGLYSVIAPFWLAKAVYNTVFSRETTWR